LPRAGGPRGGNVDGRDHRPRRGGGSRTCHIARAVRAACGTGVQGQPLFDDIRDLGKILGADYNVANLRRELDDVFGDLTLDRLAKRVLVTAFDLDNESPVARIPAEERTDPADTRLLSLGTGRSLMHIDGATKDWGYLQWVRPLISIMLDGVNGIADYQCRQMLGDSYFRIGPTFPPDVDIGMDDVDRVPWMIDFAESVDLTGAVAWMRENW
jgi:hypothetical protein